MKSAAILTLLFFFLALAAAPAADGKRPMKVEDLFRFQRLADPQIRKALQLMYAEPESVWTVPELARQVSMSRSAFALRFKELIGQAPLEYLTRCRMYKAERLLRENGRKLFEVAASVGYESGGAFHKAFKRVLGMTPGEYRRGVDRGGSSQL